MTIRRFPLADGRAPLEAPEPDGVIQGSIGLFERFRGQIQKKTDSQLVRRVIGCDGRSVVTAYRGDCQDDARATNGGGAALGVDLGNGVIVPVAADLGRSYVASSGYQGDGLAAGAFPAPTAPTAVDLALDPIDQAGSVDVSGDPVDPGADLVGATITGKVGDSRRLMVCVGDGAQYTPDVLAEPFSDVSGLTISPEHVGCIGPDTYALCEVHPSNLLVEIASSSAKTSDTTLPTDDGYLKGPLTAMAMSPDGKKAAIGGYNTSPPAAPDSYHRLYIGSDMDTAPSWGYGDLGLGNIQVYTTRCLAWGHDGNLYVAHQTTNGSFLWAVSRLGPPNTAVSETLTPSSLATTGYALAVSRDGEWLAYGYASGSNLINLWRCPASGSPQQTLTIPSYTAAIGYGGLAFGPDGKLFALVESSGTKYLAVWSRQASGYLYGTTPEIISLPQAPGGIGWLSISGDGQVCAIPGSGSSGADIITVEAPFTAGDAVTGVVTAGAPVVYQLEFDSEAGYLDAGDLVLTADASTAEVGGALHVTARLDYRNEGAVAAFGVVLTLPVGGRSVVSVSDGGIHDSEAGVITWFVPTLAVGASGQVTATLVAR